MTCFARAVPLRQGIPLALLLCCLPLAAAASEPEGHKASDAKAPSPDVPQPPSLILPGKLWQGPTPVDYAWVRSLGISLVADFSDPGQHPAPPDLAGLDYFKHPFVDGPVPDLLVIEGLVETLARAIESGRKVHVHCSWGRNRSGLVVALLLRRLYNLTGEEALHLEQARRYRALNNKHFAAYLTTLPRPRPSEPALPVPPLP